MKKLVFIFMVILVFSFSQKIYADENWVFDDWKTIKQLKQDIQQLEKENKGLDNSLKKFLEEHKLNSYLKENLSSSEINKLRDIISDYLVKTTEIENKIIISKNEDEIISLQTTLLDIKKDLYKGLVPYISENSYNNYLTYIEKNIKNFVEKNNLYLTKLKTQTNYEKKVDVLEKKIQENKEALDSALKEIIDEKVTEKFNVLISSPSFTKLTKESKIKTLEKVVSSLSEKSSNLKSSINSDSIYAETGNKKVEIYNIFIEKINNLIITLK